MAIMNYVPGVALLLIIAVASTFLAEMLPNYIGRVFIDSVTYFVYGS